MAYLLPAVCKLTPVFAVSVQTLFFDESAGRARKIWSGDETRYIVAFIDHTLRVWLATLIVAVAFENYGDRRRPVEG